MSLSPGKPIIFTKELNIDNSVNKPEEKSQTILKSTDDFLNDLLTIKKTGKLNDENIIYIKTICADAINNIKVKRLEFLLVNFPEFINCCEMNGLTGLVRLAELKLDRYVDYLMSSKQYDPKITNSQQESQLSQACRIKLVDLANKLLDKYGIIYDNPDKNLNTALIWTCRFKLDDLSKKIITFADYNYVIISDIYGSSALNGAIICKSYDIVERIINIIDENIKKFGVYVIDSLAKYLSDALINACVAKDEFMIEKLFNTFTYGEATIEKIYKNYCHITNKPLFHKYFNIDNISFLIDKFGIEKTVALIKIKN